MELFFCDLIHEITQFFYYYYFNGYAQGERLNKCKSVFHTPYKYYLRCVDGYLWCGGWLDDASCRTAATTTTKKVI